MNRITSPSGVRRDDVVRPKLLDGRVVKPLDVRHAGHIGLDHDGAYAFGLSGVSHFLRGGFVTVIVDDDVRPLRLRAAGSPSVQTLSMIR